MQISLIESRFLVNLNHDQIGMILEALIDKAQAETYDPLAKQILTFADELQKSFAAGLEERSRSYLAMQIKTRLDALED
jgi:hypothetical protein